MTKLATLTLAAIGLTFILFGMSSDRAVLAGNEGTGSVVGTIKDKSGQPAPKVKITLHQDKPQLSGMEGGSKADQPATFKSTIHDSSQWVMLQGKTVGKAAGSAVTDDKGNYIMKNVKAGSYKWVVKQTRNMGGNTGDIQIEANKEIRLDIQLPEPKRG